MAPILINFDCLIANLVSNCEKYNPQSTHLIHLVIELSLFILYDQMQMGFLLKLKGLAMIFAGQENPLIIFRSKEIRIYFKTNNKIPINLLK